MFASPAFAQTAGASGGAAAFIQFVPLIAIFVIFYFLMIRPQQKRVKAHRAMIDAVKKGDEVVTAGGLLGNPIYAPNINTRSANTVVVTPDQQPVVIGGLIGGAINSGAGDITLGQANHLQGALTLTGRAVQRADTGLDGQKAGFCLRLPGTGRRRPPHLVPGTRRGGAVRRQARSRHSPRVFCRGRPRRHLTALP